MPPDQALNTRVVAEEPAQLPALMVHLPPAPWRMFVDVVNRDRIAGWVRDGERPGEAQALQIVDNGTVVARVLANRYRPDLEKAGIGDGRFGFDLRIPGGLSPHVDHIIHVQRESDGKKPDRSPWIIKASSSFDTELERSIAGVVEGLVAGPDLDHALSFMVMQADRLLQRRADSDGQRAARLAHQQFRRRWGAFLPSADVAVEVLPHGAADPGLRALVIDETMPSADRDAGSVAILSHMRGLQHLGCAVSFVAAMNMAPDEPAVGALEALDVVCYRMPHYASVEEVLRRQADCFDVIYLHRVSNASKYLSLARQY
jgi:hypothetical protein